MSEPSHPAPNVQFGGRIVAVLGLLAGVGFSLGFTALVLLYGQSLGTGIQTVLIIIALVAGGLTCLCSAFFGLVIPTSIGHGQRLNIGFGGGRPAPQPPTPSASTSAPAPDMPKA